MARNPELAERRKQVLHTVLERNPEEAAAPIVAVHKAVEVADRVVEVVRKAAVVADSDLAAAVGLDHKT